jgi:indole-3-glycerol phosphate synthase
MNFLESILSAKAAEVREYHQIFPNGIDVEFQEKKSLYQSLKNSDNLSVIAEIKRGSPSKGHFAPDLDIEEKVKQYESCGASAISVLTDRQFFYGGYTDLRRIRPLTNLPILCKDFIIDTIQIDIAKYYGANVILLIAAALNDEKLKLLKDYATEKDLEVLLEVHNEHELQRALALDHQIIGINNRNLKTFQTDIQTSLTLASKIKDPSIAIVSESGISSLHDALTASQAGFNGVLVGESLIKNDSKGQTLKEMSMIRRSLND